MKLHLAGHDQNHAIRSCVRNNDSFCLVVGEAEYSQSLILTPEAVELWAITRVTELAREDFERLSQLSTEVLILGTGPDITFPEPSITRPLMAQGIGLEVMDTAAACRTYNILLADGRNPAAALIV